MYGLDVGFGGDFGAVTQSDHALLALGCSEPLVDLTPACLFVNATEDGDSTPQPRRLQSGWLAQGLAASDTAF